MKEFDKKGSPSREGLSKFLPASMSSDSNTRRRLTEYEIQVQDLQAFLLAAFLDLVAQYRLGARVVHAGLKVEAAAFGGSFNSPAGEDPRDFGHVTLGVSPVYAQGVQFH